MQDALDRKDVSEWGLPQGFSFNDTFDCWVRQSGHPVVYVESQDDHVTLSQERFMHFGTDLDKPDRFGLFTLALQFSNEFCIVYNLVQVRSVIDGMYQFLSLTLMMSINWVGSWQMMKLQQSKARVSVL